jgi:hypothetical protein
MVWASAADVPLYLSQTATISWNLILLQSWIWKCSRANDGHGRNCHFRHVRLLWAINCKQEQCIEDTTPKTSTKHISGGVVTKPYFANVDLYSARSFFSLQEGGTTIMWSFSPATFAILLRSFSTATKFLDTAAGKFDAESVVMIPMLNWFYGSLARRLQRIR